MTILYEPRLNVLMAKEIEYRKSNIRSSEDYQISVFITYSYIATVKLINMHSLIIEIYAHYYTIMKKKIFSLHIK